MVPRSFTPGSIGVEILLWLFFGIGILYSVWRLSGRKIVCPTCLSPDIVHALTPRGRELLERYHGIPRDAQLAA